MPVVSIRSSLIHPACDCCCGEGRFSDGAVVIVVVVLVLLPVLVLVLVAASIVAAVAARWCCNDGAGRIARRNRANYKKLYSGMTADLLET